MLGAKGGVIAKALAARYKALSPEELAVYTDKADGIRAEAEKNLLEMAWGESDTVFRLRRAANADERDVGLSPKTTSPGFNGTP